MTKQKPGRKPPVPVGLRIIKVAFPILEKISLRLAVLYFDRIFFTPLRFKTPEKELEAEGAAEKFEVSCNGKKVQCYQWGDSSKPYVLVVHGWAGRATQFRRFIPIFNEAGYRIIGFDGPAHGKSEGKSTTIEEFSAVMKNIAEIKGTPQAIIAHSFGGGASLFSVVNGLEVKTLINIASPSIADEIIRSYLKVIGGSWKVGESFKRLIKEKYGRTFEEFTALELIKRVPADFNLMIVHDEDDKDVELIHVKELIKVYPQARLQLTAGLGHNRILKDDLVILSCLAYITENLKSGVTA